ncbi:hypothetical protein [Sinorhizobium meliloti]|uniref:hypothetical protein n=1 Tax=Rhizobium meliloti TaxID=382 RepID=UPI00129646AD|nr:hypothetical protein [Sinorhizobium meliloti]MQX28995.1 hypothetical protein [Sinorhizobium meliloti]
MNDAPKVGLDRSKTGRKKGTPNKTTKLLKEAILKAAENAGDGDMVEYLTVQARTNPGPFMALLGKVLPMQISGDPENPLQTVTRIELVAPET